MGDNDKACGHAKFFALKQSSYLNMIFKRFSLGNCFSDVLLGLFDFWSERRIFLCLFLLLFSTVIRGLRKEISTLMGKGTIKMPISLI